MVDCLAGCPQCSQCSHAFTAVAVDVVDMIKVPNWFDSDSTLLLLLCVISTPRKYCRRITQISAQRQKLIIARAFHFPYSCSYGVNTKPTISWPVLTSKQMTMRSSVDPIVRNSRKPTGHTRVRRHSYYLGCTKVTHSSLPHTSHHDFPSTQDDYRTG
jgi:hypothetical protein